jgi:hypothetical protein
MAPRAQAMNFFFSCNKEVKKHINPKAGKIAAGGNFTAFNSNWEEKEDDIEAIADLTINGAGLCAWHLIGGKRSKGETNAIKAGLIIIDIDNQADGKDDNGDKIQKQELEVTDLDNLEICQKYLSFAYYSPSSTDNWPRFRLVFGLEQPIIEPGFHRWLTQEIARQIPGSDMRATSTVNLFYGAKNTKDLIRVTDKYIPKEKIQEAYQKYLTLPKTEKEDLDPTVCLSVTPVAGGLQLEPLLSAQVRHILEGGSVEDRSFAMAMALKELIGWSNWTQEKGIPLSESPLDISNQVFYCIYEYDPELDGKFNRILGSIYDAPNLKPAIAVASEAGELAVWKKVKYYNRDIFDSFCPAEVQEQIKATKPTPANSVLTLDQFMRDEPPTPAPKKTTSTSKQKQMTQPQSTPNTPTQLIQIQNNNRQFSENDIADIIVNNYGDTFLFDSGLDEFFHYDQDEGVWFINDEQHIKRRVIKTLDTFVRAGVLSKYTSATVNSVYQLLKAKLLKSVRAGRASIWQSNRGKIPFRNGVLDAETLEFTEGNQKDLYFQTKLLFDYSRNAKCPNFLSWLEWAVGKDKTPIIRAFCRAVLTGYTTGERFLHLIGPGGSGKSTMQQILIALAGYTGTHTSDLETIETNRFECHSLIGKRLLLLTDEASFSKRLDTLKKLTSSSDTLRAERKYGKEVVNFKPELLVSIASNEHISSSDISSGLERRRLTIVMDQVIDPSKRRNLISVFPDRIEGEFTDELPGIATWLLEMPYDLMRDVLANPVKYCPDLNASNLDALVFNNPICAWLADCALYAPNSNTQLGGGAFRPTIDESERGLYVKNAYTEVYASYVNYCKSNGYKHSAKPRFVDRLKETTNNVLKIPGIAAKYINGKAVVTGIRLKPFDPSTDRAASGKNRLPSPIDWASSPNSWDTAFEEHDQPKNQSDE